MALDALRATPIFAEVPDEHLKRLAQQAIPMSLREGDFLITEGDQADDMFVVVSGEFDVTKRSGTSEIPLARVGPGAIQGELAALERGKRTASVQAVSDAEVLRIPYPVVRDLLSGEPDAALGIISTVIGRLRRMEATLRQREKLAGLGTLAAGLAHELNNPAAAIRRSVDALDRAIEERNALHPPNSLTLLRPAGRAPLDALDRADAVDEIEGLIGDTEMAAALVDTGWTTDELRGAFAGMDAAAAREAAAWLAATATVETLIGEVRMAGDRISEIVGAVKSYAYLDQAPVQRIDVRKGLDDTLVILRHKLKAGIEVTREYDPELPEIEAWGSELNQVWTNLIDNAADAMDGKGAISIKAECPDDDEVRVTICDTGPGIPPDVASKIFEPFFTTKPPGIGSGLGLHISHQVVVRHGGRIDLESEPGRTCFIVTLPTTLPKGAESAPPEVPSPDPYTPSPKRPASGTRAADGYRKGPVSRPGYGGGHRGPHLVLRGHRGTVGLRVLSCRRMGGERCERSPGLFARCCSSHPADVPTHSIAARLIMQPARSGRPRSYPSFPATSLAARLGPSSSRMPQDMPRWYSMTAEWSASVNGSPSQTDGQGLDSTNPGAVHSPGRCTSGSSSLTWRLCWRSCLRMASTSPSCGRCAGSPIPSGR
jgi:signal transduction histidine kinase